MNTLRLRRALKLVWQSSPRWSVASVALTIAQGTLPLLSLYLLKVIVDAVEFGIKAHDKGAAFAEVALFIGLAALLALAGNLCSSLAGFISEAQSQEVTDHVYDVLHAKSVAIDLEYFEDAHYHDVLHRAQQDAAFRPTQIVKSLIQVGQNGVSLLMMAGLLFSFHWGVAAVLCATAVPGVFLRLKLASAMHHWQREQTLTERRAWYYHWMVTEGTNAKEIRLFDLGSLFRKQFRVLRRTLREGRFKIAARRSRAELATQVSGTLTIFGAFAFVAYQAVEGVVTLGTLVVFYQAFQRGLVFLQAAMAGLNQLYENNLFLSNLYEFLDLKPKVVEPVCPEPFPQLMQRGIVFEHVDFQYLGSARKALEDVNLAIKPGQVVALVGENGSGKTTLVKLLCRLYDPLDGRITLDGTDIRQFEISALRRQISVILQDFVSYHLTAGENIRVGDTNRPPDDESIVIAARHSGADEVITRLPQGYQTILGKWFGGGEDLSLGQWQKVALARAFLRDTQILILDEPTSALDAQAEAEVIEKFRQLAKGRTAIFISHRLSTVKMADCIHVLANGRIAESGTHEQLMKHGGTYQRLFDVQAQQYR